MGIFISKIRQKFCRHDWQMTRFQALNTLAISFKCLKCGKMETRPIRYSWGRRALEGQKDG